MGGGSILKGSHGGGGGADATRRSRPRLGVLLVNNSQYYTRDLLLHV